MRVFLPVLIVGLITSDQEASAQVAFRAMGKAGLPFSVESTWAIGHGDLDGDGDLDLAMGRERGVELLRNDGLGRFSSWTPSLIPAQSFATSAIAVGDFDGDADADLIVAEGEWLASSSSFYRNQGGGAFVRVPGNVPSGVYPSPIVGFALGDIDGDRDLDVAGVWQADDSIFFPGTVQVWRNDGSGRFSSVGLPSMSTSAARAAFADVDGDGDLDLAGGGQSFQTKFQSIPGQTWLLLNDGNGGFTDRTSQAMPVDSRLVAGFTLADVDGDADADVVLIEYAGNGVVYLNDGRGNFRYPPTPRLPAGLSSFGKLVAGDLDGDGDLDLITGHSSWNGSRIAEERSRFLRNDGRGFFADQSSVAFPPIAAATLALDLADVDGDGDLDVASGNWRQPAILWMNHGDARFSAVSDAGLPLGSDSSTDVAAGDLDGDGHPDLVLTAFRGGESRIYRGDGHGGFIDETLARLSNFGISAYAVEIADMNGDGLLDLLLLAQGFLEVRINDGRGRFATRNQAHSVGTANALDAGDIDGDGDLDVAVGRGGVLFAMPDRIFRNEGAGRLVERRELLPEIPTTCNDLRFADLDGDGDLDLVIASADSPSLLLRNDGRGSFSLIALLPEAIQAVAIDAGDVDGDGDVDLVFGGVYGGGLPYRLLLRRPDGGYVDVTAARFPGAGSSCVHVDLADLDADGDLDVVLAGGGYPYSNAPTSLELLWNDGQGFFQAQAPPLPPILRSSAAAIADLDGDGDRDLVLGNFEQQSFVLENTLRQIVAPHACISARPWTLELYGRSLSPQHPSALALWMIGSAFLDPPATFGTFGRLQVDPAHLVLASCSFLPATGAPLELRFVVPHDPWVVGADIAAQFLLFYDATFAQARFSNAIAERILPP